MRFGEGGAEGVQHPAYMPSPFRARKPRTPLGVTHVSLHPLDLPPKLDRKCGARKSQTGHTAQHDLMPNPWPAGTAYLSSSPFNHGFNISDEDWFHHP